MNKKLYKITCKGMTYKIGGRPAYGIAYVVADNPNEAYQILRTSLNKRDLGFSHEREMESIELIAEQADYPECGTALYV